jgi:hypothetical protein
MQSEVVMKDAGSFVLTNLTSLRRMITLIGVFFRGVQERLGFHSK